MGYSFDFNEWFTLLTSILVTGVFWGIRKHFRPMVVGMIWVFNVTFVATLDYGLASTPFDLYYCMDNETYEFMGALAHVFLYTPFSFIFLYFYDRWSIRGQRLVLYLLGWTCFSVFFEWITIQTGFITHTGWNLWYSIPTYPLSALILIRVYHFLQAHLRERKH